MEVRPEAPVKILAAEDNPVFRSLLQGMLNKWGYEAVTAADGLEAWGLLQEPDAPQLAILDWMMPGMDGIDICRRVRASGREPYTYIVLLTARTESDDLVQAMQAGADDYLCKPLKAFELRARLRAGLRILELQGQLMRAREALRVQATHDALTGLLNRSAILEALQHELERAHRQSQPLTVFMLDLDHFKNINDTHGHVAGDAVLREAGHRLRRAVRSYDAVGRYGGEEFLVVLPGCCPDSAMAQAERLRMEIDAELFETGRAMQHVTVSIGISWRPHPSARDGEAMMQEADEALYLAKHRGRNQIVIAH